MTTAEICIKHGIPIPASVWKRAGVPVPKYQTVASGRVLETETGEQVAAAVETNDETQKPDPRTRSPFEHAFPAGCEIETDVIQEGLSFETRRVKNPVGGVPIIDITTTPSNTRDIMPEKPKNWYEK